MVPDGAPRPGGRQPDPHGIDAVALGEGCRQGRPLASHHGQAYGGGRGPPDRTFDRRGGGAANVQLLAATVTVARRALAAHWD
ncbi:hypothetical protein Sm713_43790 [Streptomyces sp. TS71-3]|nr:hypothetical protein Sm713_43790 [Streptomyces sp. TS71-3]